MPKLLELFSGSGSVGRVARRLGWEVTALDIDGRQSPELHMSVMDWDFRALPRDSWDFVWASPPCQLYSIARTTGPPADLDAADLLVARTRQIVEYFGCPYAIENPATSRLWLRQVSAGIPYRTLTSYCCFGYPYRKDTRLATSFTLDLPRCPGKGLCPSMIGLRHSEHAQRGGGGATRRRHTTDELHRIPEGLVEEMLLQLNAAGSPSAEAAPAPRYTATEDENPG